MDEKQFKKHLRDLVHGHHNPSEHDWIPSAQTRRPRAPSVKAARRKRKAK